MDGDTVAQLQAVQAQLQSEADTLQATLARINALEGYCSAASLSVSEMLALRDAAFSDLPNAQETEGALSKAQAGIAAISKLLAANP